MIRQRDKEKILNEIVLFKDVLTKDNIRLLKLYGFDELTTKKKGTQRELNYICDIIEKLDTIEKLKIKHRCKFTPWECSVLIKSGNFDGLIFCIQNNCRADKGLSGYQTIKSNLETYIKENNLTRPKPVKVPALALKKEEKPEEKPTLNTKKITDICNFIHRNGDLTKDEVKILIKMLGYTYEGRLTCVSKDDDVEIGL